MIVDATDLNDTYIKFRDDVDSLRAFHFAANSFAGRGGHRSVFMVNHDRVANAIRVLGGLAQRQRLTGLALEIIRDMNPHAASRDWQAAMFRSAARVLSATFVDVEAATGPEPKRWSDATTSYSLAEKLLVLETIRSLCDDWIGPGWAAKELANELVVALPTAKERS